MRRLHCPSVSAHCRKPTWLWLLIVCCLLPHLQSYSPYTHCPAGVALISKPGQVAAGCYLESAAHNPGVAPLQSAVVSGIIAGCLPSYDQVKSGLGKQGHCQSEWLGGKLLAIV